MLEIKQLAKNFGDNQAVKSLNITLPKGSVLGLLGRNGAGKTTTIKMMLGLLTPSSGEIQWNGKDFKDAKLSLGYLPEERGLYPKSTVLDQLRYFGKLEGMTQKAVDQSIDYWLERLQITEYKNKKAGELSKGNQQKIQIIATLLHNPEFIILDEPFSGLDPVNANMLASVIQEEMEKGKTVIFSSHRMDQVEAFCEYVCILKHGDVVVQGSLKEVKQEYGFRNLILEATEENEKCLALLDVAFEQKLGDLYIKVTTDQEALEILQAFQDHSISLRYFKMLEPTLNEIFIERAK
ncbi:ABC transporter ATP-binding protein [Priestia taiwanensis]|uniref:ABC transporter ATP-binding protein n=1 Tax=Priestia taiwanensis TaxID=1347902 RepID=A0A917ETB6_9BACI|nr:ATP-binding cassette domain-containing protein [Priestia taiwanensis]MBM7363368.1 ABC-2 type transport system ATP-binding protein [Priestia taiwanensis]GGE77738.1 ABC transporter ATP-binding protein [Priestia taiwanensis]